MHNNFEVEQYEKIHYYKNAFKDPYEFIEFVENTDKNFTNKTSVENWIWWRRPSDNYGKIKNIRKSILKETNKDMLWINQQIVDAMIPCIDHYLSVHDVKIAKEFMYGNHGHKTLSINKYFTNAELSDHVDSFGDDNSPTLSTVIYLNDNYEGGNIVFKEQGIDIKPEAGSLVIFPSTPPYYHKSSRIISGTKYMILQFWFKPEILKNVGIND